MTVPCWLRRLGTTGVVLLCATACTETDKQLLDDVGVTRLFLTDPGLARQSILDPDSSVQVARWSVASATLSFGNVLIDLVDEGQACVFSDTALSLPVAEGQCASGILIEAGEDESASLMLTLDSMELRRAEPLDLSRVDFDGDAVLNDVDNCPLVSNPDQADDNEDGIGNACTIVDVFQGILRDSDGDGVPDASDNCIWIANPDQADTMGLSADGIPDGIGDACEEQVATVEITNIVGPIELVQLVGATSFVTVDFRQALTCEWESLGCVLEADQVEICGHLDLLAAAAGCP